MPFYHNELASLHFLSMGHQSLHKFQSENKILKYLRAVKNKKQLSLKLVKK